MKRLFLMIIPLLMMGCVSAEKHAAMMQANESAINGCREDSIRLAEAQKMQPPTATEDPKDMIIYMLIMSQRATVSFADCDDTVIAQINANVRKETAYINAGSRLFGFAIGAWAATDIVDSIAGISAGNTTTYSNSRVLDASNNGAIEASSASGTTTNIGNSTGVMDSDALGGVSNRQSFVVGEGNDAPSQSGTTEPVNLQGEGGTIVPVSIDPIDIINP